MGTADANAELQALLLAARAGEVSHSNVVRALLAHPVWLVPLANEEPGSLRPHCLTNANGSKALPLYSSIPTLLEAGWGDRPYCELAVEKAFGPHAPEIEAIVVDSASPGWVLLRQDRFSAVAELAAAMRVEQALVDLRWPAPDAHGTDDLLDQLAHYPAYRLLLQDGQAWLAPDDQQRRLLAVSTAADACEALLAALPPLNVVAQRLIVTLSGKELFTHAAAMPLDGLVFNCKGPGRAVAFAPGLCDLVLHRLAPALPAAVIAEIERGEIIGAIVALRAAEPGLGLAEAKGRVDAFLAGRRSA